jgi:hypothetical protein
MNEIEISLVQCHDLESCARIKRSLAVSSMKLKIDNDRLTIELEWYEQMWAVSFDRQLSIPVNHINRVTTEEPESNWSEIRAPGTFVPGLIKAGTYYTKRGKEFWYVTTDKDYLTIELHDEPFRRIVLTLPDSQSWCEQIDQAVVVQRNRILNPSP